MNRLTYAALGGLPAAIARPQRTAPPRVGIVHFGPGAFHRAHQASFIDRLLDHDPRWGIAAVALRSAETVAALAAQQGLYTIAERDAEPRYRIVGAHGAWLGPDDSAAVAAMLADPAIGLVTTTVTEKGYCLASDGTLDLSHADIAHDLAGGTPRSVIGWIVGGLAARRAAGTLPFVPMPCDNLASNGAKLHAALVAFAAARDAELAKWIAGEVRVPSTMVDSITPASDAALHADVDAALGVTDAIPVQRESFVAWVIEDVGLRTGPDLASVGAIVTADPAGHERAKLRILNGAHSTLAYAGLLRGHASVAEAMGDAALSSFVDAMIRTDIAPVLPPVAGLDLDAYRATVLTRFRNPAIVHRLDQIAQDGSQKLPYRLVDTIVANRRAGKLPAHAAAALGCWVAFVISRARAGTTIIDPAAPMLATAASDADPARVIARLTEQALVFPPDWQSDAALTARIVMAAEAALAGDWPRVFAPH
ncbi:MULTISPECIES: mannitol dehydrogenase family protein [Sphingomonas]|uniref:mannitol dehydrogenase family protein n=1 Tax=Sphingomonas TaxID=13687 RepID=UPI000832B214|nr:mannitol dehydrogenase family protein [Sphingomonas sp. CCH10-B3]